ncbi:hypothetical protein [Methylocella sp. CPCC 101449]|jgi:hypothetical protein|uniref:hypothetical protein n=1 Tax=Methylocella sp. CPCC 101449 TaxID=2987531 RepID=UPI00288C7763|nr:hypothetical protein [Methylocella sp. CPCC 101449]MDT2023787.1 hypothetical protein [Methylocella sp. CPCC 101449]HEV2573672.1 hypothetical protein [Beijerinckiaceae bacterium]
MLKHPSRDLFAHAHPTNARLVRTLHPLHSLGHAIFAPGQLGILLRLCGVIVAITGMAAILG